MQNSCKCKFFLQETKQPIWLLRKEQRKDIAVAFSIGIITKAEKYNSIEGLSLKLALKKMFFMMICFKNCKFRF